jgi:hypothetical protein
MRKTPSMICKIKQSLIHEDDELVKIPKVTGGQMDFSPSNQDPIATVVLEKAVRPPR